MKSEKVSLWVRDRETGETIFQAVDVDDCVARGIVDQYRGHDVEYLIPSVANSVMY